MLFQLVLSALPCYNTRGFSGCWATYEWAVEGLDHGSFVCTLEEGLDVRGREMEKWSASKEDSQKAHVDGEEFGERWTRRM